MVDFKNKEAYIEHERTYDHADGKANKSSLWGEGERNFLEDVTLNLIPDDEAALQLKPKSVSKWDSKSKKYIIKKVDREGKVVAEKRNESGVKITKEMLKNPKESIYKKWMKKTHLKLQNNGEMEDQKTVNIAKSSSEGRKMMKHFKSKHADLNEGEDAKSGDKMIEAKKKKMMMKVMQNKDKNKGRQRDQNGKKDIGDKARNKIMYGSRPTRVRAIIKQTKGKGNDNFKGNNNFKSKGSSKSKGNFKGKGRK